MKKRALSAILLLGLIKLSCPTPVFAGPERARRVWTSADHRGFVAELNLHLPILSGIPALDLSQRVEYLEGLSATEGTVPQIAARQLLTATLFYINDGIKIPHAVGDVLLKRGNLGDV